MSDRMPKKLTPYTLALLCALISLVPVLNYVLTVPAEMMVTLGAWLFGNLVITLSLVLYSRTTRPARVKA